MGFNQASFYADNIGTTDTGHQYGPFNLGFCGKMLHIVASIEITGPGFTLGSTAFLQNGIVWGLQWTTHGGSPLALPANLFQTSFFWGRSVWHDSFSGVAWAPSTDTGAYLFQGQTSEDWRGNLPIFQNIDLYVTTGTTISSESPWYGSISMRVTNTN